MPKFPNGFSLCRLGALAAFAVLAASSADAAGSPGAGRAIFKANCSICHSPEAGRHRVGPSLFGVVGRRAASSTGYQYSDAMKAFAQIWTPERLFTYLAAPGEIVPGTKMTFAGLADPDQRNDLIAYLKSISPESDQ